ncbi:hypothetical protein D3C87_249000 [compost metagenome]
MEPNKLEKDFKKKLEQRTIQPSDMAWDRLDAMLSVTEKKKPNRTWMYMAASFVVFLLVGALFLNQEKENNINGVIKNEGTVVTVEEPVQPTNTPQDNNTVITSNIEGAIVGTETSPARETNRKVTAARTVIHKTTTGTSTVNKKEINISTPAPGQEALAVTEKKEPTLMLLVKETENLMAAVNTQQETAKKKPGVKVDPNSLLSSVEGELTDNYRNKTLQGVVKNFNAVKTAVANRNRE